jgi:uncharacterized protein (DUF983 family)
LPDANPSPVVSVLRARCPRCAKGPLFGGLLSLTIVPKCSACGLDYGFAEVGDGPAVFAIFILGALVLAGAMIAEFKLGIPMILHMPFWAVATPLFAVWLLKSLKATLMLMQFKQREG